jgi:hypothetical protein
MASVLGDLTKAARFWSGKSRLESAPTVALLQCQPERNHAESDQSSPAVEERKRAGAEESGALDAALKVLSSLGSPKRGFVRGRPVAGKRRRMSAAARKRIAAAQRARWAKWRKAGHGR